MSDIRVCPADGCGYRGDEEQLTGHWGGSDGPHEGPFPGLERAPDPDPEPDPEPERAPADADNPTMPAGSSTRTTTDGVELPCGHETFDPSRAPEPPFNVICETCGESYGWVSD